MSEEASGSATWGAYRLHADGWYRLDPDFAKPVPPEAASVIEDNFWDLAKSPNASPSATPNPEDSHGS